MGILALGIIALVLGFLLGIYLLWVLGIILIVIALILILLAHTGRVGSGGHGPWY
jgi:hypothetical protein